MSISGTGTQADPYIVDTWADLVTAVETSKTTYVKVDTSTVATWDFAKMVEGGLTTSINWIAAEVDGNGLTIKGLFGTAARWFSKSDATYQAVVKNLNLLDMSKTTVTTGVFYGRSFEFRNCKFSGVIEGGNFFESYSSGVATFTTGGIDGNDPRGCAFAFNFSGDARLTSVACTFNHCNMNFDGTSTNTSTQEMKMYESKISGKMPWASFKNSGGGQNVIDAEIDTIGTWSNTSGGVTLINTDKLASSLTVPSGFTGVTSTQMLDVDALEAVGFIAETEEPEGGE